MRLNRKTLIIALFATLLALQAALLLSWHLISDKPLGLTDVLASIITLVATSVIYIVSARYYFRAIKRSTETHAALANEKLEQSLDLYQAMAEREERLARNVCMAIESELIQARDELSNGRVDETDAHLQHCLSMASEALPNRCRNVTVAAVLEAIGRQCANEDIDLESQANVPEEIDIPDIDVAAVLFSLFDRALDECRTAREEDPTAKLSITVRVHVENDQLLIEVESPRHASDKRKQGKRNRVRRGYDWNTRTVESIAGSHGGIVAFDEEPDMSRSSVMLPLSGSTTREAAGQ